MASLSEIPPPTVQSTERSFIPTADLVTFETSVTAKGLQCRQTSYRKSEFTGEVGGRKMSGSLEGRSRTKYAGEIRYRVLTGFRLYAKSPSQTLGRLVLTHRVQLNRFTRWLNRKGNLLPVSLPPELSDLEGWSSDPDWAGALLSDPQAMHSVRQLIPVRSVTRNHVLQWYPDHVLFSSIGGKSAHASIISDVLGDLAELSSRVEALPSATIPHVPTWMETKPWLIILIVIGGTLVLCLIGVALLLGLAMIIAR